MVTKRARRRPPSRTERLLALVALLLRRPQRGLTVEEAARELGCSIRTAYRLLSATRAAGLTVRRDGTRRHVLRARRG